MRRRGPRRNERPENDELRTNRRIRVPRVLLIDDEGQRLGEFMTVDAIRLAEERGLDLVEVSPNARPPVCKIADFGRMKYEKKKRDSVARKKQVQVQLKEVKVRPKTDGHDMDVKTRLTHGFLTEGHKVKITVRFRGRELAHRNIGAEQCMRIAERVKEIGVIEMRPRMEGRQMFMILAPTRRPAPKVVKVRPPREDVETTLPNVEEVESAPVSDAAESAEAPEVAES